MPGHFFGGRDGCLDGSLSLFPISDMFKKRWDDEVGEKLTKTPREQTSVSSMLMATGRLLKYIHDDGTAELGEKAADALDGGMGTPKPYEGIADAPLLADATLHVVSG